MLLSWAVQIALKRPNYSYIIFSDSLTVLNLLLKHKSDVKTNPYCYEIKRLVTKFSIKTENASTILFAWIPAHIGIQGNEDADLSAKEASLYSPCQTLKIPYTDLKESAKKLAMQKTNEIIKTQASNKGKEFFKLYHKDKGKPWFYNKNLPRSIVSMINRIRSDHYNLKFSSSRIGIIADPRWECGYETQDIEHVFCQCPLHDTHRLLLLKKLQTLKFYLPLSPKILMTNPTKKLCEVINDFLKKCEIKKWSKV